MGMMLMIGAGIILYVTLAIAAGVKIIRHSHKQFMIVDSLLEEEIKKSKRSKKNG